MMEPLKAIVGLSFRLMFRSRKTLALALISLAPPAMALLGVAIAQIRSGASGFTGFGLASELFVSVYLHAFAIGLPLFYATSFIREEVDDKTITYLFVRPVPRAIIYAGKFIAGTLTSLALALPSAILTFLILSSLDPISEVLRHTGILVIDLGILVLAIMAYCGLFGAFGTLLKRPLLWGIVFSIVWEVFITHIPGYIHNFTILHFILSLLPHPSAQRGILELFESLTSTSQTTPAPVAIAVLLLLSAAFLALSCWVVSRREYLIEA